MKCPGFEKLIEYLDGQLAASGAGAVAAHLAAGCSQCHEDRAWYQQVKQLAKTDDSSEPPPWILKRAVKAFDARRARASVAGQIRSVIASLVFDSLRRPALAGVRSSGAEGRQLLYHADDYSIDLHVALPDQVHADLTGQILREGEVMFKSVAGLPLELLRDGGTVLSTITNDSGEFRVESIDPVNYDLRIDISELSITIVGLPVA